MKKVSVRFMPSPDFKKSLVPTIVMGIIIVATAAALLYGQKPKQTKPPTSCSPSGACSKSEVANPLYEHVHALFRNPFDGSILFGTHNGLFKSTDNGKTFSKVGVKGVDPELEFMNFAYDQPNKTLYAGGHDLGVVKSTDNGTTWTKTDDGIKGADIHALAINPLDPNRLYAFSVEYGVFGTKDGAKTWYRIDDGPSNPGIRAFGYMSTPSRMDRGMGTDKTTNIGYLWAGTSGGLYSSFACFCGWTKASNMPDDQTIYALAPDPVHRSTMLIGTRDGIWKTEDEGKTFSMVSGSPKDAAAINYDAKDPSIIYAASSNGGLFRSTNNASAWQKMN